MITKTNHFVSEVAARCYYTGQDVCTYKESERLVQRRIKEGAITIGAPIVSQGQRVGVDMTEGRYFIEE